jgi:hypothetical protein
MNNSQEHLTHSPEKPKNPEVEKAGAERHEQLREDRERAGERSLENNVETARAEALEKANSVEKTQDSKNERPSSSPAERRNGPIGKAERKASFAATMDEVQSQMTTPSRAFSKVIHNKTVEQVSEATGNTIARPNALLSGAVFAFALTLAVYLVAKNIGYPLSGFESIGAFVLGWAIGLLYDFIKVMVTGRAA